MVCIPCSVNTSRVKTLNNRQFMSQSASQMLILFLSFAARWEREGRKIGEGRGSWRGDMEGKDMPAGQSCDVLRHVRICVRTCFLGKREGKKEKLLAHLQNVRWFQGFVQHIFMRLVGGLFF